MKNPTAKNLALKEGVTCKDCIREALHRAGLNPFERGAETRVPRERKYSFLAALMLEDLNHEREEGQ